MNRILSLGLLFLFFSCSRGVEGFRDIKLGMSIDDVKKTETCKAPVFAGVIAGNLKSYLCGGVIKIDTHDAMPVVVFEDEKVKRITLMFAEYIGTDLPSILHDSLSGQYGDPSKSKSNFLSEVSMLKTNHKIGHSSNFYAESSWKNGTVQVFIDMERILVFYQISGFYDLLKKEQARGKGL